jgi:multiple sugar transport system permease protein
MIMFQLPFAVFMMRNAFEAVPRTLDEAAMIDGCGSFRALLRVLLPLVAPGLVTVGLFAFLASWNDYVAPLILISSGDKLPLPVAGGQHAGAQFRRRRLPDHAGRSASFMAVPCLILFLALQRFYVRGVHVRSAAWLTQSSVLRRADPARPRRRSARPRLLG